MELLKINKKYGVKLGKFIYIFILMVLSTSISYLLAVSFKNILDNFEDVGVIGNTVAFAVGMTILYGIAFYVLELEKVKILEKTRGGLHSKVLDKLVKTKMKKVESIDKGSLQTLMENDVETVSNFNNSIVIPFVSGAIQFGLAIYYGLNNSIFLTVVIFVVTILATIVPKKLADAIEKKQGEKMADTDRLNNGIADFINNHILFKTFKADKYVQQTFNKEFDSFGKSSLDVVSAESLVVAVSYAGAFLIDKIWMFLGIYLMSINKLTFGEFVGFLTLSTSLNIPLQVLPAIFSEYSVIKVSDQRLEELLAYDEEVGGSEICEVDSPIYNEKFIEFSYEDKEEVSGQSFAFRDFTLLKGDRVELSGASGCGKSTLMKVLLGFYDTKEKIFINIDGKKYFGNEIYKRVAYIPQVPLIFKDTVMNNVLYGCVDRMVDKEEVVEVCKLVNLHQLISGLSEGYDSVVDEKSLSTGQKQRLSIARALISKKDVLFLDEITSALDSENEKLVLEVVKNSFDTIVLISHKEEGKLLCNSKYEVKGC